MRFHVRMFDPAAAEVREQTFEHDSRESLEMHLLQSGVRVLSVQANKRFIFPRLGIAAPVRLDVAWWCRELRTLLNAGMTVVEALETLQAQPLGQARERVHSALVTHLRNGLALSAAMGAVGGFSPMLVAGVKAGERTSSLVEALDDFLRYHDMLERLRRQVASAAIYPAVVVSLGAAVTFFLLLFVIPRFARMYSDLRGPMSWTTKVLVTLSRTMSEHSGSVLLGLVLCAGLVAWSWRSGLLARLAGDMAERIGPLQRQLDEFRLAKLYHSLALMFRGGYALDNALGHCIDLGLGLRLRDGVRNAQASLARGQRVSAAFAQARLTDEVSRRLLSVGERTGNFDRVLQTIAERHAANFATFVERSTRVVEPILLLLVALVVGGIVVMMYMPVFDIAGSIR